MSLTYAIALLFILSGVCYVIIASRIYLADKEDKVRKRYSFATLILAVWAFSYGMMTIGGSEESARSFWSVGFAASCLFFPAWIHFLSYMSPSESKISKIAVPALYLAAAAVFVSAIASNGVMLTRTTLGYQYLYDNSLAFLFLLVFLAFSAAIMIFTQIRWLLSTKTKSKRRSAVIFTVLTLVVAPPGIVMDFAIPIFFHSPVVPLGCVFVLLVALKLFRTVHTHRLLNITVQSVSIDMFSVLNQPILVLNSDNYVVLANKATKDFWAHDITGQNMASLIMVDGKEPSLSFFDESCVRDTAITVTGSATRETKNCGIVLSVIKDKYDDVSSKILIVNDVTELLKASDLIKSIMNHTSKKVQELLEKMAVFHEKALVNAKAAEESTVLAVKSSEDTVKSSEQMAEAIEAIDNIRHISNEMGSINKIINKIAFQTNILALNASVEAGRAGGEAGRSFAAVADEVRSLANGSTDAAAESGRLIQNTMAAINAGSEEIQAAGKTLNAVQENAAQMKQISQNIAQSVVEQQNMVEEVKVMIETIDTLIHKLERD